MEDSSDSFSKLNTDVSRETLLLFHKYRDLIINEKQSLISKNDQKHTETCEVMFVLGCRTKHLDIKLAAVD